MRKPFLKVEHLTKNFAITNGVFSKKVGTLKAVNDVSIEFSEGEILGVVGESGCGKSTLAKMIMGLIQPDDGRIVLDGYDLPPLAKCTRPFQMVFQDPFSSLNPRMSVGKSISEPLIPLRLSKAEMQSRIEKALISVGLNPSDALRYPHQFSGGQRQRIAIARALITNPRFVVCDEAVSALDASVRAQILNLLLECREKTQYASMFISHDLSVVAYIAERIAVMYLGSIVEEASRDDLIANPLHPYTQILLSGILTLDSIGRREDFFSKGKFQGEPPSPINPPHGCPFHTRCPHVAEICQTTRPKLKLTPYGGKIACHIYGEAK